MDTSFAVVAIRGLRRVWGALAMMALAVAASADSVPENPYLGASHVPASQPGWERFQNEADPDAPKDEPMGGFTRRGTPVNKRTKECFPAEQRNLFNEVDEVPGGPGGALEPFDFSDGGVVSDVGRDAIRGRNTWMLWGEGNEAFWGWLQEEGYGLIDFLVLLDSRVRDQRFQSGGMINQPGMKSASTKILGLYLDAADGAKVQLQQPATDLDHNHQLEKRAEPPADHANKSTLSRPFEPADDSGYAEVVAQLAQDGVDPNVYGYPSGVVGLRLMPNPDYFGRTPQAAQARAYWKSRVIDNPTDAYYTDPAIQQDPRLVRPFRVSMSCGYCHTGPHPLNPPADPEAPAWSNLSNIIGNQYWSPPALFANLVHEDNLLYQFLASQQPGTIDTSLVSTDHINNANTINAIFNVPARLVRAGVNVPELQSPANLRTPVIEESDPRINPRHTPRVLLDGADSIGAFGALSRVYLNIGTFSEEWAQCHNPLIGYKPQRPFSIATLQKNSVYWQAGDLFRIPYLKAFFTYPSSKTGQSITAPMKLADVAPATGTSRQTAQQIIEREHPLAANGRSVFLQNCAICHSSKQPDGFELTFSADWAKAAAPAPAEPTHLTLPTSYADWEAFRHSKPFAVYVERIAALAGTAQAGKDEFLDDNYLSTDIRIPITLVGTNSGRSVGTNGMRGQVWDNFSSEDYKHLPAVGAVRFYNPYLKYSNPTQDSLDVWGNNDQYYPPPGGPGYYRPASLVSLWATAPYLHNNALGNYPVRKSSNGTDIPDPSVEGRLQAFDDGIEKLFSKAKRRILGSEHPLGDWRGSSLGFAEGDPGFIYRTTAPSWIKFPALFIKPLLVGILGNFGTHLLTTYLWVALALVAALLTLYARPRHAGFLFLLLAVVSGLIVTGGRFGRVSWLFWLIPVISLGVALWFWLVRQSSLWARGVFGAVAVGFIVIALVLNAFVDGKLGPIKVGPIPQGTPINLLMNINPEAPMANLLSAVSGVARALLINRHQQDALEALHVFEAEAGQPLLEASKCPDFVLDRGHWFAEELTEAEKANLKAFLRTL
jgi:mono/diheme cytochrome c family protein